MDLLHHRDNCRPESASEFIYIITACIFACHLRNTGMPFGGKAKLYRKRSGSQAYGRTTFLVVSRTRNVLEGGGGKKGMQSMLTKA